MPCTIRIGQTWFERSAAVLAQATQPHCRLVVGWRVPWHLMQLNAAPMVVQAHAPSHFGFKWVSEPCVLGYKHVNFPTETGTEIICHDCHMIIRLDQWRDHERGKKHKLCSLRNIRIALAQQSSACEGAPWWIEKRLQDLEPQQLRTVERVHQAPF